MAKQKVNETKIKEVAQEMSEFLMNNTDADFTSLKIGGQIPYWIDTRCYAFNWIIGNDFFQGVPGCRIILVSGECLGDNTEITINVDDELANIIKNKK